MEKKLSIGKTIDQHRFLSSMAFVGQDGNLLKIDRQGNIAQSYRPSEDIRSQRLMDAIGLGSQIGPESVESHRIVSGKGTVTRFFKDGTYEILYASGHIDIGTKGDYFFSVYADGRRELIQPKQNERKFVDSIKAQEWLDPESGITSLSRSDYLTIFKYPDGSRLSIFPDGTRTHSNPTQTYFKVEHAHHETVEVYLDPFRARNPSLIGPGSAFATKGRDDIFERSYTGRKTIVTTKDYKITTVKEMRELEGYNNFRLVAVSIVDFNNGVTLKFDNYGEIIIVDKRDYLLKSARVDRMMTSVLGELERRANRPQSHSLPKAGQPAASPRASVGSSGFTGAVMNSTYPGGSVSTSGQVSPREQPFDHFIQLFLPINERAGGVYTLDLAKGEMFTRDFESNEFLVTKTGKVRSNVNVSFNLNNKKPAWDVLPLFEGKEFVDPVNLDLPVPKEWQPPMLGMIDNQGKASVLYAPEMLVDYFESKLNEPAILLRDFEPTIGAQGLTVLTGSIPKDKTLPTAALPSAFKGLPQSRVLSKEPDHCTLLQRTFTLSQPFSSSDLELISNSDAAISEWRSKRAMNEDSRKIFFPSLEERKTEMEFQQRLLSLADSGKNIIVYGQSNKTEISNPSNVVFADT